jgi:hypothetical protein
MIFIDGFGVGKNDPSSNPFAALPSRIFRDFLDTPCRETERRGRVLRADATLGVEGLPQSATGQTALLTGVNAPAVIGRHLSGFPTKTLKQILYEHSILKTLTDAGRNAAFINVFNPLFFEAIEQEISFRASATTLANMAASLPFFRVEDLFARRAVYQEFTNRLLIEKGFDAPIFEPGEAGEILARSAASYDFCLYEYFQTDAAGHSRSKDRALEEVRKLDEFLLAVLENTDLRKMSILVTSDHGNIEDLSVATHTRNPVPVLLWGALARRSLRIKSILDIVPFVLKALKCA